MQLRGTGLLARAKATVEHFAVDSLLKTSGANQMLKNYDEHTGSRGMYLRGTFHLCTTLVLANWVEQAVSKHGNVP